MPEIFTAFVRDFVGIELEIDRVETDKVYVPPIGSITTKFALYAQDKKNRVIVDMQHVRYPDHYHRFLHYHCAALLEQVVNSKDYRPKLKIFTLVVLTSSDKHKKDIATIDFDPKDRKDQPLGEIAHKVIYICPKYLKDDTPIKYREWLAAIEDSLDEQVDESRYTKPEIQRIFTLIEKDKVTPEERARMFDEYGHEEIKQEGFQAGKNEGLKEGFYAGKDAGLIEAREKSARNLLSIGMLTEAQIAQVTGLTLERVKALAS